jgi:DNA-binding FrmR family transcriptional regulator
MEYEFRDGKLLISRTQEEREPIVQRLRRIEGQVRGLAQMIADDRYCLEEVQQANAITSAMREVALAILSSHLDAGVDYAVKSGRTAEVTIEVTNVLRAALKL